MRNYSILIVEDDFMVRRVLKDILSQYGDCDIVIDGSEAVQAFRMAWEDKKISFEELLKYKHSTRMELADRLLDDLLLAVQEHGGEADQGSGLRLIMIGFPPTEFLRGLI